VHDLVIRNGTIVDGTGTGSVAGDIAIAGSRVVATGQVDGLARREIDAAGQVVAPGFIDIHTHYDAQVMWDPMLTPSSFHGVTTAIGGNCGFTIAPITSEGADYLVPMLARVEGMSLESLQAGLDLRWRSFGEWLGCLDGKVGLNVGFLVGHSALRRYVMGTEATGRAATEEEIRQMAGLLAKSITEGGLGLSSTNSATHNDHLGNPVPSRWAELSEFVALSGVVGEHAGTTLELIPSANPTFDRPEYELMAAMSRAANRPLNWNLLSVRSGDLEASFRESKLSASNYAADNGGRVVALMLPQAQNLRLNFLSGMVYDSLPDWFEVLRLPVPKRIEALKSPAVRASLAAGAERAMRPQLTDWAGSMIVDVADPALQPFVGRTAADIGAERDQQPFDALLDIVIADKLATGIKPPVLGDDDESWAIRAQLVGDERVIVGGSDAGAHLDMLDTFAAQTSFLAKCVRQRNLLSLPAAIHALTDAPARLYGLRGRGRIAEGWFADLVIFDPEEVGPGQTVARTDMPAGGWRLTSKPTGIDSVIVNGTEVVHFNEPTGERPGMVLRSGADTDTVLARSA
jgi:N-acyl-D-aspartate/D-glutamate deacylase